MKVPKRFTQSIESWLQNLTTKTFTFRTSSYLDREIKPTIYIGDIHADPRGFISALFIASVINKHGSWTGDSKRVVCMGDILDGAERIGSNRTITKWDEVLCLRILFTLKQEAQSHGGDIIWVIGNHDIAAVLGDDSYLNPIQALGYSPFDRKHWFQPGKGVLSIYMARCGIIAGIIGNTLVSHAGICQKHIEQGYISQGKYGMNEQMRRFLLTGDKQYAKWYTSDSVITHREFDIQPFTKVPINVIHQLDTVSKLTGIHIQLIGHNFRPSIQKIKTTVSTLFFTDTGISRSFGKDTKIQCILIHQTNETFEVFSVS